MILILFARLEVVDHFFNVLQAPGVTNGVSRTGPKKRLLLLNYFHDRYCSMDEGFDVKTTVLSLGVMKPLFMRVIPEFLSKSQAPSNKCGVTYTQRIQGLSMYMYIYV